MINMKKEYTMDEFPLLKLKDVRMRDECEVLRKINKILGDGAKNLQVVTDYDGTLTKYHVNGKKNLSSFCVFRMSLSSEEIKEKYRVLFAKYHPIEIDESLSVEVRAPLMQEWYEKINEVFKGVEVVQEELYRVVKESSCEFRDHTKDLFQRLAKLKVPILVFSAGIGDIIEIMLKKDDLDFDNIKIMSNFLKFEGNIIQGFKNAKKMIHVFNKNEHALEEDEYFQILKHKHNGLLMGDHTGDSAMTDGIEHFEEVLKIGFLNKEIEKNLPAFMEKFDIVIIDDQTMNIPLDIIKKLDE